MVQSIFTAGQKQNIAQVLAHKDARVAQQAALFAQAPQAVLLDVKLNIPGPIKNNQFLTRLFATGCQELETQLQKQDLTYTLATEWMGPAGNENFYLLSQDCRSVKKAAIAFEDESGLTRLFDADVLTASDQAALSRQELGLAPRRCFLCQRPAKDCARSRRHAVAALQAYISHIYEQTFN